MANPPKDLNGMTFGYLTVVGRHGSTTWTKKRQATWLLRCVCGAQVVRAQASLTSNTRGAKKSCGCRHREMLLNAWNSHGMTGHPAWVTWQQMRQRCTNPENKDWKNYGGRGVTVCKRWADSFAAFWEDMGPTWALGLTLDRRNNDVGYTKRNCRWATAEQQSNNTRVNRWLTTPDGRMTVAQASRRYGIKRVTLYARLNKGFTGAALIAKPRSSTS